MTLIGLAARNALRNKFRTALTIVGVAVAVLTFVLLRTFTFAWTSGADYAAKDRIITRHKVTFVMTLPKTYINAVRAADHVKAATWANWFGGKDPKHESGFFASFAVDADSYLQVYDDIGVSKDQLDVWNADPQGAIVGDVLAKKMGWKVGDKVFLTSGIFAKDGDWEFHIDGIYEAKAKSVDRSSFIFKWEYLNNSLPERRKETIGWITSRVDDPAHTADISKQLDEKFDSLDPQTVSQDEHSFNAGFLAGVSVILTAVDVVSIVILVIMLLVLGNTIAMGVRERTNEYGVLKALGFSGGQIAMFIVVESLVIATVGGAFGLAISYPFIEKGFGKFLEENMGSFFPYFRIPDVTALVALGLAIALGVIAAAIPAYRASKLRVIDALRRVA